MNETRRGDSGGARDTRLEEREGEAAWEETTLEGGARCEERERFNGRMREEGATLEGVEAREFAAAREASEGRSPGNTDPRVRSAFQVPEQRERRGATDSSALIARFHSFAKWRL